MNNFFASLLLFVFSGALHAREYLAYKEFIAPEGAQLKSHIVVNLGRTRSQDGIGNCFAFSLSKRLEHLCSLSSTCDLDGDEISPLYIQSLVKKGIASYDPYGASTKKVLELLGHTPEKELQLVKESCAPYDQVVYKRYIEDNKGQRTSSYYQNQYEGILFLEQAYKKIKNEEKSELCIDCSVKTVNDIKQSLTSLKIKNSELLSLIKEIETFDERKFVSKILISNDCYQDKNMLKLPRFKYGSYGAASINNNIKEMQKKIEMLLAQSITPELLHCSGALDGQSKRHCGSHAVIIQGQRKWCNKQVCSIEYKLKNSWGMDWQEVNNDGWVDAQTLLLYSLNKPDGEDKLIPLPKYGNTLNWVELSQPELKNTVIEDNKLYKCELNQETPAFVDAPRARILVASGASCSLVQ